MSGPQVLRVLTDAEIVQELSTFFVQPSVQGDGRIVWRMTEVGLGNRYVQITQRGRRFDIETGVDATATSLAFPSLVIDFLNVLSVARDERTGFLRLFGLTPSSDMISLTIGLNCQARIGS